MATSYDVTMDMGQAIEYLILVKTSIAEARYVIAAMFGLQLYEWFACLEDEIRLIHRRARLKSVKTLYLLCRYYPLFLWIVVLWAYVWDHTQQLCERVVVPVNAILAPCQFFSQAVMLMRAYAFSGRDSRILLLLTSCYFLLVAVEIWVFCTQVEAAPHLLFVVLGRTGCFPDWGSGWMGLRLGYAMLAATLMDLVSLGVVCAYCIANRSREVSLGRYFLNQGILGFGFITLVNITAAISYFKPPRFHTGVGMPLAFVMSNIVACRIILQLRAKVNPTSTQLSLQASILVQNALDTSSSSRKDDSWLMGETL